MASSNARGKVLRVPIHTKDWELVLGVLACVRNGVDQSSDASVKKALEAVLVRQGKLAHKLRIRQTMPPKTDCETCDGTGRV